MGSHDDKVYLRHIIDAISTIEEYLVNLTEQEFYKNKMAHDAIIRQLEIIGEATSNISTEFKQRHSDIPWRKMADMRNRLIHGYFGLDLGIVWDTVQEKVPTTKQQLEELIRVL